MIIIVAQNRINKLVILSFIPLELKKVRHGFIRALQPTQTHTVRGDKLPILFIDNSFKNFLRKNFFY